MRSWWIGLYRGSDRINSVVDRGPGACVRHTLRVIVAGTWVPFGGTDPSGSVVVLRRL